MVQSFKSLTSADIKPRALHIGQAPLVDMFHVTFAQADQQVSIQRLSIDFFRFDMGVNFVPDCFNLVDKLRPEQRVINLIKFLKVFFCFSGPDHRFTVSVLEKLFEEPADFVLFLCCVIGSFLEL